MINTGITKKKGLVMSIDSVIIKVLYQLPNVYVDKDKFDFKYFESLPGFRKSCRDKSPEEKRIHFLPPHISKEFTKCGVAVLVRTVIRSDPDLVADHAVS